MMIKSTNQFKADYSLNNKRSQIASKQNKHGAALQEVKVDWLRLKNIAFIFSLNGKAFTLNKTNKTYIVE